MKDVQNAKSKQSAQDHKGNKDPTITITQICNY